MTKYNSRYGLIFVFKVKYLIQKNVFQLVNLHLWQAVHCALHNAQCTLHTTPASEPGPEPGPGSSLALLHSRC